jgi:hypothetical protein
VLYGAIAGAGVALILAAVALYYALSALKGVDPARMDNLTDLITKQAPSTRLVQAEGDIEELTKSIQKLEQFANGIDARLDTAVQRVGLQRFNSTSEIGGDLSFALTILDARKHGVMLTSLTDHGGTRLYVRGIIAGESRHPLLPNEEISLQQALDQPDHN